MDLGQVKYEPNKLRCKSRFLYLPAHFLNNNYIAQVSKRT
jgi:hypothetical protein